LRTFVLKQLHEANAPLCDEKARIFRFVTFLSLCKSKSYVQFSWLKECHNTKWATTVIAEHMEMMT